MSCGFKQAHAEEVMAMRQNRERWKAMKSFVVEVNRTADRALSYASACDGQRELMQRWKSRGVTPYRNGIEFPNSPIHGMKQLVWFEELLTAAVRQWWHRFKREWIVGDYPYNDEM
jgi:hypothetical protein